MHTSSLIPMLRVHGRAFMFSWGMVLSTTNNRFLCVYREVHVFDAERKGQLQERKQNKLRKQLQTQRHQRSWKKTTAAVVEIIEDEFCEDHEYNSNVDESATEDLIEKVLVEPKVQYFFVKRQWRKNLKMLESNHCKSK